MTTVYFCEIEDNTNKPKQYLSVLGKNIVKHIACKSFDIKSDDIEFAKTENGKPYIRNLPNFHFNISHSKNAVAVAVCDTPIGIDIEKLRKADLKVADRFFTKEEQDYVNQDPTLTDRCFFEIWTKKEAYIKKHGLTLKSLRQAKSNGIFTTEKENYIISVCCEDKQDIEIIAFNIENLKDL